ncbi:MAG: hypothetical protein HOV87_11935 [Catenulispora sp.]|nr:hypothetical protein [Catenulispora sp.]NUT40040.1 hypothetical protein [Thermoactinospora sp.]
MITSEATTTSPGRRWGIRYALAIAAAALVAVVGIATPASAADPAGRYDGQYPSAVSGCGSNVRVGGTKSVYDSRGVYYGWMEQRWSNSGSCWGYQWIRLHLTRGIPVARWDDGSLGRVELTLANQFYSRHVTRTWYTTNLASGTYNGRMLYAPYDKLDGTIGVDPLINDAYVDTYYWTSLNVSWTA